MRMALSYQTDELVRLGMLSTESASRWRDTYLPRMYKERKKDPITQAIIKRFDIKGEHLKGRGQFKEVDSSEVVNYLELGWEDRGVSSKGKLLFGKITPKKNAKKWAKLEMLCCALQQVSYQLSAILLWPSCLKNSCQ